MSLTDDILNIWNQSVYTPPSVPLLYYNNEYMAVVDDNDVFLRFISVDGQVYVALNNHCDYINSDKSIGPGVYICEPITPILCAPLKGPEGHRDFFVLNNIIPLLQ